MLLPSLEAIKPLKHSFLSEDEQDEELANCEQRAQEEAAQEAAGRATIVSCSAALPEVASAIEVVEEPVVESAEVTGASIDV